MQNGTWKKIIAALSEERLSSYYKMLPNTQKEYSVLAHYTWNQELCASLYPWLSAVEVTLRNSIHRTLSADTNTLFWFDNPNLIKKSYEIKMIRSAKEELLRQEKPLEAGRIIAELNFGFWTSLFHSDYEYKQILWPRLIPEIFPSLPKRLRTRKELSHRLRDIRLLRNRVFHYEPICHWRDLQQKYVDLQEILHGLSPEYYHYILHRSTFENIFTHGITTITAELLNYLNVQPAYRETTPT